MSKARKTLKRRLFQRDGWKLRDPDSGCGVWFAWCAFGCGGLLKYDTATIDHYPIPRRLCGPYTFENTRLACAPCNNKDGGPAGAMTTIIPQGLTPLQRRQWWVDYVRTAHASRLDHHLDRNCVPLERL